MTDYGYDGDDCNDDDDYDDNDEDAYFPSESACVYAWSIPHMPCKRWRLAPFLNGAASVQLGEGIVDLG